MKNESHKKRYSDILKTPFHLTQLLNRNQLFASLLFGVTLVCIVFYFINSYEREKILLLEGVKKQFEISINQFPQLYEEQLAIRLGARAIEGEKRDSVSIHTEDGVVSYKAKEEKLLWRDFFTDGFYTILHIKNLICVKHLNSLLKENLNKNDLPSETIIWYSHKEDNIEEYSDEIDSSYEPIYTFPLEIGFTDEINLQCFIKLPFGTVFKRIKFWYFVLIWLFLIPICIYYIYKLNLNSMKKRFTTTDLQEIANTIPNSQARMLFNAFLDSPNRQLTNKEISLCLWGYEKDAEGGIRTPISRLRKELKNYPFLTIKSIHSTGYELIIKS